MNAQKSRLLVIDDDLSISAMLKTLLEFNGYEVFVSDKPLEAKENIEKHNVDLIILDMRLSGVNGTDVCIELKKDDSTKHVPILMMSALYGADEVCKDAGAEDFISKPFEMEDLLEKINEILSNESNKKP